MSKTFTVINTVLGDLTLTAQDSILTGIYQEGQTNFPDKKDLGKEVHNLDFQEEAVEIQEYLNGERKTFTVASLLQGTPFQKSVWRAVDEVPYGETITYQELAELVGKEKSVRAVASAVAKNPLTLIIPCHRVVAKNKTENYSGGIKNKRFLLELEAENV